MATVLEAPTKTAEDLRREIDELQRQQREAETNRFAPVYSLRLLLLSYCYIPNLFFGDLVMASFTGVKNEVFDRQQRRQQYHDRVVGLNAYERHKQFMLDYQTHYGGAVSEQQHVLPVKTDRDTLKETYRFIRSEEDDLERSWEQRLAKRYHDKLFKEYCIADMSRYKENRIGLRWRTEKEVMSGKGQFECGNKKCTAGEGFRSYEVNFAYSEAGESKQALVKLRVCPKCSYKLNYRKEKELERESRRKKRRLSKESKREKRGRRSSKEKRTEAINYSPPSYSEEEEDSDDSGSSEDVEESRFKRTERKEALGKASEKKDEEFEPYFKDMFL